MGDLWADAIVGGVSYIQYTPCMDMSTNNL
jgi:hypothetical protein